MDRRKFLGAVSTTVAGAGAATLKPAAEPGSKDKKDKEVPQKAETRRVSYRVKGFTCITCAVGLEVMLRGLKGVARANASYPENTVAIGFDDRVVTEKALRDFISVCGFSVA